VLSEPHSLLDALYLHNREVIDQGTYSNLLMNILRVHIACATAGTEVDTLVVKPVFKCTPQILLIQERFPRAKIVFLFRDVTETVNSFLRVMAAFTRFSFLFTNKCEILSWWCDDLPLPLPASSHGWARHPALLVCKVSSPVTVLSWRVRAWPGR